MKTKNIYNIPIYRQIINILLLIAQTLIKITIKQIFSKRNLKKEIKLVV